MKPEQQEALRLRESGMSRADIAAHMGKSERQVKSLLERARKWQEAPSALRDGASAIGADTEADIVWTKTDKEGNVTYSVQHRAKRGETTENLLERVAEAFENIPAYEPKPVEFTDNGLLTVYPLYDMHVGMMAWGKETGGQDYDLSLFKSDLLRAIETVAARSPQSAEALVIFGGDTLHVDDDSNETPGSHHKMDADGRFEKITDVAIEAISHSIEYLSIRHARVRVVVLQGNHDKNSHIILKASLKQRYRLCDRILFENTHQDKYWIKHGKTLIFAHHGDKMKPERLAMIVADQCPHWSNTRYRVALTGHLHHMKVQDFPGVTHYTLRAFAPADAYGASFGGVRGISAMTFSEETGLTVTAYDPIERDE